MANRLRVQIYRWHFRYLPWIRRVAVCSVLGHRLGQIEMMYRNGWPFHRPCKRCRVEVGCRYAHLRGIYEYQPGFRHDGRLGVEALIDELTEAERG